MSLTRQQQVLACSSAKGMSKFVLFLLAFHENDNHGYSFPTIKTLAKESGLSDRQVSRCLSKLKKIGEISLSPNTSGKGLWLSNKYAITVANSTGDKDDTSDIDDTRVVTQVSLGGCHPRHQGSDMDVLLTEPSIPTPTRSLKLSTQQKSSGPTCKRKLRLMTTENGVRTKRNK